MINLQYLYVFYIKNVATAYFFWNTLPLSYEHRFQSNSTINLLKLDDVKLLLISPNLVWPLGKISNKWNPDKIRLLIEDDKKRADWIANLVELVRDFALKLIRPDLKIYLLAQHWVFRTGHNQAWFRVFTINAESFLN